MIDSKQIKLVQVAKRKLGLTEDEYRDILARIAQVQSARELTSESFARLMDYFRKLGFVSDARRAIVSGNTDRGMASQAQIDLIINLWREVATEKSVRDLEAWIKKQFKAEALRFLTAAKARKAVGALRLWKQRMEGSA